LLNYELWRTWKMNKKMAGVALAVALVSPPAWADPTVITACQTISQPGAYVLANDIGSGTEGADCLTITVSNVTIDLAGFSVSGPEHGIIARAGSQVLQGITVRNRSVGGRVFAVLLEQADGSIVEGLHTFGGLGGGIVAKGIVRGNTAVGGFFGEPGISASGVVTDNYVSGGVVGIAASGTVRGNTAIGNVVGIDVSAGSTVIGNTATGNSEVGIQADCPSNLTDNTAVNNGKNLVLNGNGCHNEDNVAP
jgi:hypothetical protein